MEALALTQHFRPPAFPGSFFISFEGIEASGKTTQINILKAHLEKKGHRVLVLREPGGTVFGEKLRQAILGSQKEIHPLAECFVFAASRTQLLNEVVLQELGIPNTIVILDRYIDSTIAYQGIARGLGAETVLDIHKKFPLNLVPHLTFYIRIDVATSIERQRLRNTPKDYFESLGEDFYRKLIQGYDLAATLFPQRIMKINGENSAETVTKEITSQVDKLFERPFVN